MPVLIGLLFGQLFTTLLGRIGFWRAAVTAGVWYCVGFGAYRLVEANVGTTAAPWGAILAPAALLAWTLWHPTTSRVKLWLFDGLYVVLRLCMIFTGFRLALDLLHDHGRLALWLAEGWRSLVVAAALWLVQRGMIGWLRRSHVLAGDRSLAAE